MERDAQGITYLFRDGRTPPLQFVEDDNTFEDDHHHRVQQQRHEKVFVDAHAMHVQLSENGRLQLNNGAIVTQLYAEFYVCTQAVHKVLKHCFVYSW